MASTYTVCPVVKVILPTVQVCLTFNCYIAAPKIFPIAYALVKPFLNEVTRNKVKILEKEKTALQMEYKSYEILTSVHTDGAFEKIR